MSITQKHSLKLNSVPEAVEAIRRGKVVIVVDAEDRENEGDYICAAEMATAENVNFMLSGRGQLCVSILADACARLELSPLVANNVAPLKTAFLTPIDIHTSKTGITAAERSETIRRMASPECHANEFTRPGHVFPLLAKEGGVLRRAGHTEAALDLARMAGLQPTGVLCEVLDETGDRASHATIAELALRHDLKVISIEDLIFHRRMSENLVNRTSESALPTRYGDCTVIRYAVEHETQEPIAIVFGDLSANENAPLVRVHSSCFTGDIIASLHCDRSDQLHVALDMISQEGRGALVYLPTEASHAKLAEQIRTQPEPGTGNTSTATAPAKPDTGQNENANVLDYGIGLQVLKDLGLRDIRLLTNNPKNTDAFNLRGYELRITDQIPLTSTSNQNH